MKVTNKDKFTCFDYRKMLIIFSFSKQYFIMYDTQNGLGSRLAAYISLLQDAAYLIRKNYLILSVVTNESFPIVNRRKNIELKDLLWS
jgi:hypothetical protein